MWRSSRSTTSICSSLASRWRRRRLASSVPPVPPPRMTSLLAMPTASTLAAATASALLSGPVADNHGVTEVHRRGFQSPDAEAAHAADADAPAGDPDLPAGAGGARLVQAARHDDAGQRERLQVSERAAVVRLFTWFFVVPGLLLVLISGFGL